MAWLAIAVAGIFGAFVGSFLNVCVYRLPRNQSVVTPPSRCLTPVDGFFEFTDPSPPMAGAPGPKKKPPKSKWAFTLRGQDFFFIAGIWRTDSKVGEAFSMLTCPPGPDIAPYHDRQMVVIAFDEVARWLDPATPSAELCRPLPAGSLDVTQVR